MVLRGRLPVRATADGTGGHVPHRSVGATGGTGDRGVVVALDVTRARRTGRGLVHGGAIADGVTLDGGVEVPAIGDARRFGGEAAGKAGPLFLRRRRSGGAQAGEERVGGVAKKAGGGAAKALARTAKLKAAIMSTPPSVPVPAWRREAR